MSADLLVQRTKDDAAVVIAEQVEILVDGRNKTIDALRFHQGFIAGMRHYEKLLDERRHNLHANG